MGQARDGSALRRFLPTCMVWSRRTSGWLFAMASNHGPAARKMSHNKGFTLYFE
jgi:hypothetical protein